MTSPIVGVIPANSIAGFYAAFSAWQQANGEKPRAHRWLTRTLQERGFAQAKSRVNGRRWEGLSLREEETRIREVPRTTYY